MEILQIVVSLKDFFVVLGGAASALAGAALQNWYATRQSLSRLHLEKIERAYLTCQRVVEGHHREFGKLRAAGHENFHEYVEQKQHPGTEMSELKMLVRCYFYQLEPEMKKMDVGHATLKALYAEIESWYVRKEDPGREQYVKWCEQAAASLSMLDTGASELKVSLAKLAPKFL